MHQPCHHLRADQLPFESTTYDTGASCHRAGGGPVKYIGFVQWLSPANEIRFEFNDLGEKAAARGFYTPGPRRSGAGAAVLTGRRVAGLTTQNCAYNESMIASASLLIRR